MKTKASQHNRFFRFVTLPVKFLGKARDLYVRSLTGYAGKVNYGGAVNTKGSTAAKKISGLPKSFSVGTVSRRPSESEDYRELLRAASTRTLGDRGIDIDNNSNNNNRSGLYMKQIQRPAVAAAAPVGTSRSCSVGMGRIDEERESDFDEEKGNESGRGKVGLMYPRSKSYAV
ncbi:uncharacterized protein LOC124931284 [Impatiens glandulifera]|uniref:uncharacterized protein LOC124931284 n=1 Tax=Impatiens glandulifera TaxID=253017 RepID=UPI001FB07EFD|nr:uncharacterized protein LOC124931284 [Impatiens glandulifera]